MGINSANKKQVKRKVKSDLLLNRPFEWTPNQKTIVDSMLDKNTKCVFIDGYAGTGKTVLSVYSALTHLQQGLIDKIYYIRSAVESAHSKLGYLPGDISDKFGPYAEIIVEAAKKFLTECEIKTLIDAKKIETIPVSFLRGRDLVDCVVIVDESQNLCFDELVTIATRVGQNSLGLNSKIFFIGDTIQSDLPRLYKRDFENFIKLYSDQEAEDFGIKHYSLGEDDVMRSAYVKFIIKRASQYRNNNQTNS